MKSISVIGCETQRPKASTVAVGEIRFLCLTHVYPHWVYPYALECMSFATEWYCIRYAENDGDEPMNEKSIGLVLVYCKTLNWNKQ